MAVGTSTASAALGLFGNANLWCWIEGAYPLHRLLFFYIWYWASLVVVTISMLAVVWTVRVNERASLRYSANKRTQNSKKVATQAVLYIGGYYLTALFSTTVRVWQAFSTNIPFWAVLGMTIFYPAQGLINFFIYIRPRYVRYRQRHPEWSLWSTLRVTLLRAIRGAAVDYSLRRSSTAQTVTEDDDFKLGTPLEADDNRLRLAAGTRIDGPDDLEEGQGSFDDENQRSDDEEDQEGDDDGMEVVDVVDVPSLPNQGEGSSGEIS
eukprot:Sro816_g206680.1 n/a (265) ;mRNA; r:23038-23832